MKQVASLRYDVIFKKAFSQPDIFTAFVKDILEIELNIEKVETDKTFDPPIGKVANKMDLYAEDKQNRVIVEIQHEHYADHYDRFLYYHCCAVIEQIASSKNYQPGLTVFTVVILTSSDQVKSAVSVTDFDPRDVETNQPVGQLPHKILFLCPKYVTAKTPAKYREWLQAIQDSLDEQVDETQYTHPAIQKVFQTIEKDLITPQERARMFEEYNQEQKKREIKEEGRKEGEEKGRQEGAEKGRQEGEAKGRQETATALLSLKILTIEQVAQTTGLTVAQVNALVK